MKAGVACAGNIRPGPGWFASNLDIHRCLVFLFASFIRTVFCVVTWPQPVSGALGGVSP